MINAKVEDKYIENKEEYPCLKVCRGTIVIFISPKRGIVLHQADNASAHKQGVYIDYWSEELFVKFAGQITLSNEL